MKQGRRWTAAEAESVLVKANLQPLAPFKTDRTAWPCRCLLCGETIETTLQLVALRGYGCTYCSGRKVRPSDAEALLAAKFGKPLEPFPNSYKQWKVECLRCGRETLTTYKQLTRPDRKGICKHCAGKVLDPEYIARVVAAAGFDPLEPYPGTMKPWLARCVRCGETSSPWFSNLQKGHGCRNCANRMRGERSKKVPSLEDVRKHNIEPLVPYPGRRAPWKCRCLKCGREVSPAWGSILFNGGDGCIQCGAEARGRRQLRKDKDVRAEMIAAGYEPLEAYPGGENHWRCRCLTCGDIVTPRFGQIRSGYGGCRRCGEAKVAAFAESRKLPEEIAVQVMLDAGYEPLEPYTKSNAPWKCRHDACGQIVTTLYATIQQGKGGCRTCAENGIDYSAPALLYLMRSPEWFSLKVGITSTTSMSDRIGQHLRRGWELHRSWQIVDGYTAEEIEGKVLSYWRNTLEAPVSVPRDVMPQGGYTETVSLLFVDIEETIALVESALARLHDVH